MKPQDYSRFIIALEFFNNEDTARLWELLVKNNPKAAPGPASLPDSIAERLQGQRDQKTPPLVELLAFALMPNHFHLIIREIKKDGIIKFMTKMGGYSIYFNKQYDRVGPLFQSRYKAVPVRSDQQLYRVFSYVQTNPVQLWDKKWKNMKVNDAKSAIEKLEEYKWSSYRDYIGEPTHSTATERDFFNEFFGGSEGCRAAVEDWIRFKAEKESEDFGPEIIE